MLPAPKTQISMRGLYARALFELQLEIHGLEVIRLELKVGRRQRMLVEPVLREGKVEAAPPRRELDARARALDARAVQQHGDAQQHRQPLDRLGPFLRQLGPREVGELAPVQP